MITDEISISTFLQTMFPFFSLLRFILLIIALLTNYVKYFIKNYKKTNICVMQIFVFSYLLGTDSQSFKNLSIPILVRG